MKPRNNSFAATSSMFAASSGGSSVLMAPLRLYPIDAGEDRSDDSKKPSDDSENRSDDFEHDPKLPKDREIIF